MRAAADRERRTALLHLQQFRGTGHRVRMSRIAAALDRYFDVLMLDGGPPTPPPMLPPTVAWRPLEPLFRDRVRGVQPLRPGISLREAHERRRRTVLAAIETHRPALWLMDFYPLGRWSLAPELEAAIDRMRRVGSGLVVTSVRDVAVNPLEVPDSGRAGHAAVTLARLARVDAVLVHTDPSLIDPARVLPWLPDAPAPVIPTGFVAPRPPPPSARRGMVVSMGGGLDGFELGRAALDAWALLRTAPAGGGPLGAEGLTLFGGPYLPPAQAEALRARCAAAGVRWRPFAADFLHCLARARLSVSRAGYNTVADLLVTTVPAVLSPAPGTDQEARAEHLEEAGLATLARDEGPAIARAAERALLAGSRRHRLHVRGAAVAARWLRERLR